MANEYVKNLKGSSDISCGCSDYLCHWENYGGKKADKCGKLGCSNKAVHGGHVIKCHGNSSNTQYIIPLCRSHNSSNYTDCFYVKSTIPLVNVTNRWNCKKC